MGGVLDKNYDIVVFIVSGKIDVLQYLGLVFQFWLVSCSIF